MPLKRVTNGCCASAQGLTINSFLISSKNGSDLVLAFESKELRTICESEAEATKVFGSGVATSLRRRLADLLAATVYTDVLVGNVRIENDGHNLIIDLCKGYRVVLVSNHVKHPKTESGHLDWSRVNRLRLVSVELSDE